MKFLRFLYFLLAMAMLPAWTSATPLTPPPPAEVFANLSSVQLEKQLPKTVWSAVQNAIQARNCLKSGILTGHRSRKPNAKTIVITVPCESARASTGQYPLTLVVQGERVQEVSLGKHEFLYNSGHIAYITDMDNNDMPEFWLWGYVCECTGDGDPSSCNCDGSVMVEFKNGSLQPWKK